MGRMGAEAMVGQNIPIEVAIGWHLGSNHYPPVPEMAHACLASIRTVNETGDWDKQIKLPPGVTWKGRRSAPASAIIEGHHLEPWIDDEGEL